MRRRVLSWLVASVPGPAIVLCDVLARRAQLGAYTPEARAEYIRLAAVAAVLWTALVVAAARDRGALRWVARASFAGLAFVAVGTQAHTFVRYGTYLTFRVALQGSSLAPTFAASLWSQRAAMAFAYGPPTLAAIALPVLSARLAPSRPWPARGGAVTAIAAAIALLAAGAPTAGWDTGAPPDALYLASVGALAKSMHSGDDVMTALAHLPASRSPGRLPPLTRTRKLDVVFVVNESVRAPDGCGAYDPSCEAAPRVNALLPARFGFRNARAVDSTTAVSLAVMWSGLSPTASREDLHTAPLLWEYAHAAGFDTAYFSAQNLLFANAGRWLAGIPASRFVSGTEIDPYATYQCGADDGALMDRALAEIATMREPYFAVVHLSNTHFPYWIDDADAPFTAAGKRARGDAKDEHEEQLERYRDAIRRQDVKLARFLAALRARPESSRTVIVYASDHGEQVYERGQIGHTWSVYDEEIRIPLWIDAPDSSLAPDEEAELRALESARVTSLDIAPTILDLLGALDDPAVRPFRAKMPGVSLLREAPPANRAVVMTNCTELFSCATRNWGVMRGAMKLHATEDEGGFWKCFDIDADPHETRDLGVDACGDLRALAEADGRGRPAKKAP